MALFSVNPVSRSSFSDAERAYRQAEADSPDGTVTGFPAHLPRIPIFDIRGLPLDARQAGQLFADGTLLRRSGGSFGGALGDVTTGAPVPARVALLTDADWLEAASLAQVVPVARPATQEAAIPFRSREITATFSRAGAFYAKTAATRGAIIALEKYRNGANADIINERQAVLRDRLRAFERIIDKPENARAINADHYRLIAGEGGSDSDATAAVMARLGADKSTLPLVTPGLPEEKVMRLFVADALGKAGRAVSESQLAFDLLQGKNAALNERDWAPIRRTVRTAGGDAAESAIVPHSRIGQAFAHLDGRGINAETTASHRAVNVAVSSLTHGGAKLFEGVRHAALSAFGIDEAHIAGLGDAELKDLVTTLLPRGLGPETGHDAIVGKIRTDEDFRAAAVTAMRAEGSRLRALDIVRTIIAKDEDRLLNSADENGVITIGLSSISLLTPGWLESRRQEDVVLKDQFSAWNKVGQGVQTLKYTDANGAEHDLKVRLNVAAFNFGVDQTALRGGHIPVLSSLFRSPISGWYEAEQQNAEAMESLIGSEAERRYGVIGGRVGEWLEDAANASDGNRAHVETLARQIGEIWDDKTFRSYGNEPYKIVSRLALLTGMIGDVPCWNCKYGKDRTGILDVEVKNLALRTALDGKVPEADAKRTVTQMADAHAMLTGSGNFEYQRYNVGVPGYKLPALTDLLKPNGVDETNEAAIYGGEAFKS